MKVNILETIFITQLFISPCGFVGLFSMFGAYQRWCRTTSAQAQYFEKMLEMCGLIDDPDCPKSGKHRELERAEIQKSEKAVQRTISPICNFTNTFSLLDNDHLRQLLRRQRRHSSMIALWLTLRYCYVSQYRHRSWRQWRPPTRQ